MRTIPAQRITEAVAALCIEANTHLPADVEAALQAARASEPWPLAQTTLGLLCDNLTAAGEAGLPICQDTGMACVFVELGPTSTYATCNIITAPKELHPYLETKHFWYEEQYAAWNQWLWKQMGL